MAAAQPVALGEWLQGRNLSDNKQAIENQTTAGQATAPPPARLLLLKYNPQSLARFSQGTSVVIATLLAIPDSIALIPSSSDALSWALRLIKIWLVALILWFVGFLAVLHIVRLVSQGIRVDEKGIRLWRFGRAIPWSRIQAVSIEGQELFSRLFGLMPVARRLTIYLSRKPGSLALPQHVPSFLFKPEEFDRFYLAICTTKFKFAPSGGDALICPPAELGGLKRIYRMIKVNRALLSVLIAVGLVFFLGRKAAVHYLYGSGNKAFQQRKYQSARVSYSKATAIDPAFAQAWHNLAGAEFRLGNFEKARQYWHRALFLKPDLVEPKVSLAYLYMQQREFAKAEDLLKRALRLAPRHSPTLINMADLNMRLGHTRTAMKITRLVITQEPSNHLANCLLAKGRLQLGEPAEALKLLVDGQDKQGLKFGETFCRLVAGEAYLALGQLQRAALLFDSVLAEAPGNAEAMTDLAKVRIAQQRLQEADDLLYQASQLATNDPWPYLLRAELQLRVDDPEFAEKLLRQSLLKVQDARSLAESARLSLSLGRRARAIELADRALALEPLTPQAHSVLSEAGMNKR